MSEPTRSTTSVRKRGLTGCTPVGKPPGGPVDADNPGKPFIRAQQRTLRADQPLYVRRVVRVFVDCKLTLPAHRHQQTGRKSDQARLIVRPRCSALR